MELSPSQSSSSSIAPESTTEQQQQQQQQDTGQRESGLMEEQEEVIATTTTTCVQGENNNNNNKAKTKEEPGEDIAKNNTEGRPRHTPNNKQQQQPKKRCTTPPAAAAAKVRLMKELHAKRQALLEVQKQRLVAAAEAAALSPEQRKATKTVLAPIRALVDHHPDYRNNSSSLIVKDIDGLDPKVQFIVATPLGDNGNDGDKKPAAIGNKHSSEKKAMKAMATHDAGSADDDGDFEAQGGAKHDVKDADTRPARPLQKNIALLKRKLELKARLVEAKAKKKKRLLDNRTASENGDGGGVGSFAAKTTSTTAKLDREELLKLRKEAERKKAVTLYKHLVAKQETLCLDQDAKFRETQTSLQATQDELSAQQKLAQTLEQDISTSQERSKVLDRMVQDYVQKLVDTRERLYREKQRQQNLVKSQEPVAPQQRQEDAPVSLAAPESDAQKQPPSQGPQESIGEKGNGEKKKHAHRAGPPRRQRHEEAPKQPKPPPSEAPPPPPVAAAAANIPAGRGHNSTAQQQQPQPPLPTLPRDEPQNHGSGYNNDNDMRDHAMRPTILHENECLL